MNTHPHISDIPSQNLSFNSGDRLLARVSVDLDKNQQARIHRSIQKFCGAEVRILVVNCLKTRIVQIHRGRLGTTVLVDPRQIESDIPLGVANLECSVVDLKDGDRLVVSHYDRGCELERKEFRECVRYWAGKGIEISVESGS